MGNEGDRSKKNEAPNRRLQRPTGYPYTAPDRSIVFFRESRVVVEVERTTKHPGKRA